MCMNRGACIIITIIIIKTLFNEDVAYLTIVNLP